MVCVRTFLPALLSTELSIFKIIFSNKLTYITNDMLSTQKSGVAIQYLLFYYGTFSYVVQLHFFNNMLYYFRECEVILRYLTFFVNNIVPQKTPLIFFWGVFCFLCQNSLTIPPMGYILCL